MSDDRLVKLKLALARAEGALKGHVSFMLAMHKLGAETELMWERLQEHHDEVERAKNEYTELLFAPVDY